MVDIIKEILIPKTEFTETNQKRLRKALIYIKNNLIDSDGNMYQTADFFKETNNITACLNKIILRKVNVKPCGFDQM